MKPILILILLNTYCILTMQAQNKLDFSGQFSAFGNYSPDNDYSLFIGGRYLPELNYNLPLDSGKRFDFLASANISGSVLTQPFKNYQTDGTIAPYRFWARYAGKNYQIRLGLQKIDFGSASLLRPLQWFNQIDPRDPLALTEGVYGLLCRYFFKNNANIWLWGLYGNSQTRGFDVISSNGKVPEYGGRLQLPIPKGEIGFTYHHRNADASDLLQNETYHSIPENRFAVDTKLDLIIGVWLEATYIRKEQNIGLLTHQNLINIGADYTFGIGNGLTVIAEQFISSSRQQTFAPENISQITATSLSYPIGFFDTVTGFAYYNWDTKKATVSFNYQHQFKNLLAYAMVTYNPETQQGIQQNELVNNFTGPGFRLMLVYNH